MWKSWPYWVRGGITGAGLFSFLTLLGFIRAIDFLAVPYLIILLGVNTFLMEYFPTLVKWLPDSSFPQPTLLSSLVAIIFSLIIFFFLGAFFGWIYGKIKSRKAGQVSQNSF